MLSNETVKERTGLKGLNVYEEAQAVEQDALMSPNPRGKLEDLAARCACVV